LIFIAKHSHLHTLTDSQSKAGFSTKQKSKHH